MNVLLFCLAFILLLVNFLAIVLTISKIGAVYKLFDSFVGALIASLLGAFIFVMNVDLVSTLDESNKNGLSVLVQVGILVIYALLIMIFDKINYKRNVKPNLQIKI